MNTSKDTKKNNKLLNDDNQNKNREDDYSDEKQRVLTEEFDLSSLEDDD